MERYLIVTKQEKEEMIERYKELKAELDVLVNKINNSYTEEEILAYTE